MTSAAITGATLTYQQYIDTDEILDVGSVRLLDADAGDAELAVLADGIVGIQAGWSPQSIALPPVALGRRLKIEFRFVSDNNGEEYAGFFIDDVVVTRD
jgi:hypothetical protein